MPKSTFASLQAELTDADYKVRKAAIKKLMRSRSYRLQALEPLLVLLHDPRGDVRNKAVQALGRLGDPRALKPLMAQLSDKNAQVRAQVARALGNLGNQSAVQPLIGLLGDDRSRVRQAAARALGRLKDPRALTPLLAYLAKAGDQEIFDVAYALGELGDLCVVEPLLALLDRLDGLRLKWAVADALGRIGEPVVPVLLEVLADPTRNPPARVCAVQTLVYFPRPELLQPLIAALSDSEAGVRLHAAQGLGALQDPAAIQPLLSLLDDQDTWVCCCAIFALSRLNATCAVEPLIALLSSPHANIVSAAAQALGQLHDPRALTPLLNAFFQNPASTWQIARALCELNNPAVIEPLLQRLPAATHEQLFHSLVILNHFPDKRAIEPLWSALSTNITAPNQPYLQMQILFLLGRLGEADAVERLRKLLDTTHLYYRAYVESLLKQLESAQL